MIGVRRIPSFERIIEEYSYDLRDLLGYGFEINKSTLSKRFTHMVHHTTVNKLLQVDSGRIICKQKWTSC
jgi:hypothetical protein